MGRIIATPFSSKNLRILEKTNIRVKDLIKGAEMSKKKIDLRNIKNKIESKPLSKIPPGRIE